MEPIRVSRGRTFVGSFRKGDDLLDSLICVCEEKGIKMGKVEQAIGAVRNARLAYRLQDDRDYAYISFDRQFEIINLTGNISMKDAKPFIHAHITLSDEEGRTFGGHLLSGTTVFLCEYIITEYLPGHPDESIVDPVLVRVYDDETGLFLWP